MKPKLLLSCFILFSSFSFAQITSHGFSEIKWKTPKTSFTTLKDCNSSQAGENFENCEYTNPDSLFLHKYKYSFANFRFYKGKLCETNFDLRHSDLANLISQLTVDFGKPVIKENKVKSPDPDHNVIGYEWIVGDTKILILNKGLRAPVWCILSSVSMKNSFKDQQEIDIENLIFE